MLSKGLRKPLLSEETLNFRHDVWRFLFGKKLSSSLDKEDFQSEYFQEDFHTLYYSPGRKRSIIFPILAKLSLGRSYV